MMLFGTVLALGAGMVLAVLGICCYCFRVAFYAGPRSPKQPDRIETPEGAIYDPYRADMERWILEARAMPQEHFTVRSFDGLTLHGTFYEVLYLHHSL